MDYRVSVLGDGATYAAPSGSFSSSMNIVCAKLSLGLRIILGTIYAANGDVDTMQ